MDRTELRGWIEDALARHDRDVQERDETLGTISADEIMDTVWGRLPLAVRRETTRASVQASLMMLTLRHGIATNLRDTADPAATDPAAALGLAKQINGRHVNAAGNDQSDSGPGSTKQISA
jgi:hypothetical protein